jgi:hypothetical protein
MAKTPTATVKLTAWQLVAIEEALSMLVHADPQSLRILKDKIAKARVK